MSNTESGPSVRRCIRRSVLVLMATLVVLFLATTLTRWWRFALLTGKGEFVSYTIPNRDSLRAEDQALRELIPPEAADITIWSFRFRGQWGGRFTVKPAALEACLANNSVGRFDGVAIIDTYNADGRRTYVDTTHGPVYRRTQRTGETINSDYLLSYDRGQGVAYFTFTVD